MPRRGVAAALLLAAASALVASPAPVEKRYRVSLEEIEALAEQARIDGGPLPSRPLPTGPRPAVMIPDDPYRPVVQFTTWWFSGQHAARYGGLYVDEPKQTVVVHVTGDVGDYEETVRLVAPGVPVVVRRVVYSLADLHRGATSLRGVADRLLRGGRVVEVYGPDIETNRVWVRADAADLESALLAVLPGRDAGMLHLAPSPPWAA